MIIIVLSSLSFSLSIYIFIYISLFLNFPLFLYLYHSPTKSVFLFYSIYSSLFLSPLFRFFKVTRIQPCNGYWELTWRGMYAWPIALYQFKFLILFQNCLLLSSRSPIQWSCSRTSLLEDEARLSAFLHGSTNDPLPPDLKGSGRTTFMINSIWFFLYQIQYITVSNCMILSWAILQYDVMRCDVI